MLPPGSAYTIIVGDTAEAPVRGAGPVSVAASAVLMLSRALALESAGKGVRVNSLVLGPVKTRRSSGRYDWVTSDEVGETALWLSILGEPVPLTAATRGRVREPYFAHIMGSWREAAQSWEALGCPYEQAIALTAGDEAARRATASPR